MTAPDAEKRPVGLRCQLAAICDGANLTAEGKLNIFGEFDRIHAASIPVEWRQMYFVAKLKVGAAAVGKHTIELRVIDDDMQLVATPASGELEIPPLANPGIENDVPLILGIVNARFRREGEYQFELLIDGRPVCEPVSVHVVQRKTT